MSSVSPKLVQDRSFPEPVDVGSRQCNSLPRYWAAVPIPFATCHCSSILSLGDPPPDGARQTIKRTTSI